eukprot:TRINITY_DN11200_c0_g1_i1.p1 TRINITY_DN11200_c0_g1~~TRINITY_DN11200_c0_g1_i1.p1  ORF type:complete len:548 (-),score=174.83 TRINITY_DN11200_c0_g1_i1:167-1810(-)
MRPISAGGVAIVGGGGSWGGHLQLASHTTSFDLVLDGGSGKGAQQGLSSSRRGSTAGSLKNGFAPRKSTLGGALARSSVALGPARSGGSGVGASYLALKEKSASTGFLRSKARAIDDVKALGSDKPYNPDRDNGPKTPHELLMSRLQSRQARVEADNTKDFLVQYREDAKRGVSSTAGAQKDAQLEELLRNASERTEFLSRSVEALQEEFREAERVSEKMNALKPNVTPEMDLQALNPFERSQRRIQDDKIVEQLQHRKEEAAKNLANAYRNWQADLVDLRDQRVLLAEFRQARLSKLETQLGVAREGSRLRACVREMIKLGDDKLIQKLENYGPPLETWMREVLVNLCRIEVQAEEMEKRLSTLREVALRPKKADIEDMMCISREDRAVRLCRKTQEMMEDMRASGAGFFGNRLPSPDEEGGLVDLSDVVKHFPPALRAPSQQEQDAVPPVSWQELENGSLSADEMEMRRVATEVQTMRRLAADIKENTAAIVCNRMRQENKQSGASLEATWQWGRGILTLLVSEEFSKRVLKQIMKSTSVGALGP